MRYLIFLCTIIYTFNSFSLNIEDSVKSTIENNINIKIALEEINESKELIETSLSNYKPDLSITLSEKQISTETTTSTSSSTTNKLQDSYSFTVKQNLYRGGRNQLELEKSKILFNKQLETFYSTINDLILRAIDGYLTVQLYNKSLIAIEKNFEVVEQIYLDTLNSKELGVSTLVDLKKAESSYEKAKSNLILAKSNLEVGNKTFKNIVGLDAFDLKSIIKVNKNISSNEVLNNALKNNHNLKILNLDYEASKLDLEINKRNKYPTFDLTGNATYNDNVSSKGTETTSGSLEVTLSIPIFQKGIENSNIRKFKSKNIQADYKTVDQKELIELNSIILVNNYNVFKSQIESTLSSIEANEVTLDLIEKEYELGLRVFSDVLDQEQKLLDASLENFNRNKDFLITYFEILSLEGKLIDEFKEYLPQIN